MKRIVPVLIVAVLLILCSGWIVISVVVFHPYEQIPLTGLHWGKEPGLIAVQKNKKKDAAQTLLVRLQDGKEQPLPGLWTVNFSNNGNAFVFGEYKDDSKKERQQKLFYVEGGRKIHDIDITNTKSTIVSVQENPKATYLFIKALTEKNTIYCIFGRVSDLGKPECQQLDIAQITDGLWNPKKDHELVIKTPNDGIIVYDPWEKKPRRLTKKEDQSLVKDLLKMFTKKNDLTVIDSIDGNKKKFFRVFNLVITPGKNGFSIYHVPLFSKISWLHDGNHILMKDNTSAQILELSSRKTAALMKFDNFDDLSIKFRNKDIDQEL